MIFLSSGVVNDGCLFFYLRAQKSVFRMAQKTKLAINKSNKHVALKTIQKNLAQSNDAQLNNDKIFKQGMSKAREVK